MLKANQEEFDELTNSKYASNAGGGVDVYDKLTRLPEIQSTC
ncbi:hypothetical protein EGR_10883 [Echinococcus granulosus]|uniref:Uncharacterized protein n=1 Tax=Echinococcus granulosus TaxID=6210 RepID=W6U7B0_ECHGR|nr:hypothetical protein EGR_10883 [Echinococcus granulosus]EUB54257.1 hypothetical protein EGR_10883 [Echinococcus granulosus]